MDRVAERAETLVTELDRLEGALRREVARAAAELDRAPPRNAVLLASVEREITELTRHLHHLFQQISTTQGEAGRLAAAAGQPLPQAWHLLSTRVNLLRIALNRWHLIRDVVAAQAKPRREKLAHALERVPPTLRTQVDRGDALLDTLHRLLNPAAQDSAAEAHGCFRDIALSGSRFMEAMHAAYRLRLAMRAGPTRFLDIGCGGGLKILSAAQFFDVCHGIEYDPGYAEAGARLMRTVEPPEHVRSGDLRVFEGDALAFEDYGAYDVLYFYRPIRLEEGMEALERRILDQARPGAILVAPYNGFGMRRGPPDCVHVAGPVFLAGMAQRKAARLRRLAELTGPAVRPPKDPLPGVWEPILAASRANGFDIARARTEFTI